MQWVVGIGSEVETLILTGAHMASGLEWFGI